MEIVEGKKVGFKKSNIGWVPKDWAIEKLGDISNIKTGKKDNQDKSENGEFPFFVRSKNIELIDSYSFDGEAILVPGEGNIGEIFHYIVGKFEYHQRVYKISDFKENVLGKYIHYYFQKFFIREAIRHSVKATVDSLRLPTFTGMIINLPPFREQNKIATILSDFDDVIENTKTLVEKLQLRKKGLMQQLLTGKTRLAGFTEEWRKLKISEIATQFTDKNKNDDKIEVLSCTKYDGLVRSLDYFGRKVFGDDLSKYKIVPNGYFAYATNHIEEGSIGYQDLMDRGLVSPMYTVFKTDETINDSFMFRLLKTERMIYNYQSNMSGSIARRGGLRWSVFETINVLIPSLEEQNAIADFFYEIDKEIEESKNYLMQLEIQKKGLMQQLLTGKIRVN